LFGGFEYAVVISRALTSVEGSTTEQASLKGIRVV